MDKRLDDLRLYTFDTIRNMKYDFKFWIPTLFSVCSFAKSQFNLLVFIYNEFLLRPAIAKLNSLRSG